MDLQKFIQKKEQKSWNIHGIQVSKGNEIIEQYGDCKTRYPIYSITKSITSSAVGIAVEEGRFSIHESLYEYIKDRIPATLNQAQVDLTKKITIERLLTMSVKDLPFRAEGADWLQYALLRLPSDIDSEEFHYSNISAYLVSFALQCALSEHLIQYLTPRFFEPLSIAAPEYQNDPQGHFYGATGMSLSVEELARIGQLYLNGGSYNKQQILSKAWVKEATKSHISNREGGYGYFIWKYHKGFSFNGKWGQRCIILPDQNLLVTYLSDMKEGSDEVLEALLTNL